VHCPFFTHIAQFFGPVTHSRSILNSALMKSSCLNRRRSSVCKLTKRAKTQIQKEGVSIQSHISRQSRLPQITFSQRGLLMGAGVRCPNDNNQTTWINFSYA